MFASHVVLGTGNDLLKYALSKKIPEKKNCSKSGIHSICDTQSNQIGCLICTSYEKNLFMSLKNFKPCPK